MLKRSLVLSLILAIVLTASTSSAQALPCSEAYAQSGYAMATSIRAAEIPGLWGRILEIFLRASIRAVEQGSADRALTLLQAIENAIDRLERDGSLDEATAEALLAMSQELRAILAHCTATPPVVTFNCRSGDGSNELMWLNPDGGHVSTTILVRSDRFPTGPADADATVVAVVAGSSGDTASAVHDGLANGTRYFYAAYAEDGSGELAPGRFTSGRPQSTSDAFRWSYTTGGTGRPSIGGFEDQFTTSSSTGFLFSLEPDADGGRWPEGSAPARLPWATVIRPTAVPGDVSPDGNPWAIATTLDGRVRAFNAATGAAIWTSPELGDSIEASVCAMITAYEGVDDVIMVGVNNRFGGSRFVGLDLATGSELWSFDNGGGWNFIGDISGMCTVDYGRQRVYFTSELERWGTRDTVWALEIADGSATRLWSASHAGVNTPAVLVGEKLYVGTDLGDVLAIDIDDGGETWRYTTGDGPVEGFIFPQRNTGLLAFSTSNRVHLVEDTGSAANAVWQPGVDMPGANTPLIRGDRVLVADADGNVYNLDATVAQPAASPFATFGDSARRAAPGMPYFDWRTGLYGVGTPEGVIYVVQTP